jgi:mersacidin/lichenicidin family type 2 lantibiotic
MKSVDVARAWKNEEYRLSLSEAERAMLPGHPSGAIELNDADLSGVAGGTWTITIPLTILISILSCIPGCEPDFSRQKPRPPRLW